MSRIAIFASGNGSNFEALANNFVNDPDNEVTILICNVENAFVLERARRLGIKQKVIKYDKNNRNRAEDKILEILKDNKIDVVLLAGFMKILSSRFLKEFNLPVINIHPSILPKYKGVNAIERAFESDDNEIGITIHYVNEEVDSGEIILQKKIPLLREEGVESVEKDVHRLEHKWYPIVAKQICDTINETNKKLLEVKNV